MAEGRKLELSFVCSRVDEEEEEEEALSLSDLPVATTAGKKKDSPSPGTEDKSDEAAEAAEEFEFRTWGAPGLCTADELFFQGQILPLRPSISSESGCGGGPMSRCGSSRTESMDRYSAGVVSLGFDSVRSFSSGSRSSSSCISRSQSSNSCSSTDAPRLSVSNNFYAHPSPSPQLRRPKKSSTAAARKSTGSPPAGWVLLRLGVAKTPEIELNGFRPRRSNSSTNGGTGAGVMKSIQETTKRGGGVLDGKLSVKNGGSAAAMIKAEKKAAWFLGFGCRCSPDSVEGGSATMKTKALIAKKKGGEEGMTMGLKRGESMRHGRIFEWLEELSMSKATVLMG